MSFALYIMSAATSMRLILYMSVYMSRSSFRLVSTVAAGASILCALNGSTCGARGGGAGRAGEPRGRSRDGADHLPGGDGRAGGWQLPQGWGSGWGWLWVVLIALGLLLRLQPLADAKP